MITYAFFFAAGTIFGVCIMALANAAGQPAPHPTHDNRVTVRLDKQHLN